MKKVILILTIVFAFFACSPEQGENDITVDLTKVVNPTTVKALSIYNETSDGIYRGVFVAEDGSHHGVLTINAGNDRHYNAVLEIESGKQIGFNGTVSAYNKRIIDFISNYASFTLDLTSFEQPKVVSGFVNGLTAQAKVIKEFSNTRVAASLGTFVDNTDATFSGTWDLLSTSTRVVMISIPGAPPQAVTVNNIDTAVVCRDGGIMHSDSNMEDVTPSAGCVTQGFPTGTQQPFFSGEQTISIIVPPIPFPVPVDINEFFMPLQTSEFGGATSNWSLVFSKANSNVYYDNDCTTSTSGTFSYGGRTGSISIL